MRRRTLRHGCRRCWTPLCDLSSRDALTGLVNRRSFEMASRGRWTAWPHSGGAASPAAVPGLTISKAVNDTHGHGAGDLVIGAVAEAVNQAVRPMDPGSRRRREEFAIILLQLLAHLGAVVAERIRTR